MWIPKNVSTVSSDKQPFAAAVGSVNSGTRNSKFLLPYGISSIPPNGTVILAVPIENDTVIGGVIAKELPNLEPGEVMLYSRGGASIALKNNGDVIINGTVFERNSGAEV